MDKINLEEPNTEVHEIDGATAAAIEKGAEAVREGRTVSLDEARKMIPQWISKFESRKKR